MDLQKMLEEVKDLETQFKAQTVEGHELSNRNRLLLERQGGFE